MSKLPFLQIRYLAIITGVWTLVFLLTRLALMLGCGSSAEVGLIDALRIYATGAVYDGAFLTYALIPLSAFVLLCPQRLWQRSSGYALALTILLVSVFVMLFVALAEWVFWDEFQVRFNFIAVDYLVYSDEVINNILQSYPVFRLLGAVLLVAALVTWTLRAQVEHALQLPGLGTVRACEVYLLLLGAGLCSYLWVGQAFPVPQGGNSFQHELALNGPYQFFAAFRSNELDYARFYAQLPDEQAARQLRRELEEPRSRFVTADAFDIRRDIDNAGAFTPRNVVLVTVESLSARYLGFYGDTRKLTPNLDRLMAESLNFTRFYATGTRTARGLEAITLSIPPTPGRSIVKRIGHEGGFASLGRQFARRGYDTVFLYGGRGYFDNMNAFFSGNGYRVIDQDRVEGDAIQFANAWGMSDEDLYRQALRVADQDHQRGTPFFLQLMTTSNHRPYTYPDGRIDIPSGQGRAGAVKYTDFAIGQFLQEAAEKPWFANTLFVFVADHTAGSAGKRDLPVAQYHIPCFIYAPGLVAATQLERLSSQIDLAPTLLGLLHMDYRSAFYGRNLLLPPSGPDRALIANYQHLGLFDGTDLAILSPRRAMRVHPEVLKQDTERRLSAPDALLVRDMAYYQGASYAYTHGLLQVGSGGR